MQGHLRDQSAPREPAGAIVAAHIVVASVCQSTHPTRRRRQKSQSLTASAALLALHIASFQIWSLHTAPPSQRRDPTFPDAIRRSSAGRPGRPRTPTSGRHISLVRGRIASRFAPQARGASCQPVAHPSRRSIAASPSPREVGCSRQPPKVLGQRRVASAASVCVRSSRF